MRSAKALSYITKMRFHSDAQNQASPEEVKDRYKELRDRLKQAGVALHIAGKSELWIEDIRCVLVRINEQMYHVI